MTKNYLIPILFALLVVSCGGGGTAPTPAAVPTQPLTPPGLPAGGFPLLDTPLAGQIAYANGTGDIFVVEVKPGAKAKKVLAPPNDKGFLQEPAWSPDGQRIVYSYLLPFESSGLPSQDILIASADGTNPQTLIAHKTNGEVMSAPVFSPDGRYVYYSHSTPIFKDKQITGVTLNLERLDVQTKQSQVVTPDGTQPDVSPDGKRIAFIRINPQTFQQELMVVDADGKNLEAIVPGNAVGGMLGPRWTRDGKRILFAMPNLFSRYRQSDDRLVSWLAGWLEVRVAEAHGPPWDFWIVDANGENLQRLTEIGEDEPTAGWSPDGKHFAFLGVAGFYIVDESGKQVRWLMREGGRGRVDWKK